MCGGLDTDVAEKAYAPGHEPDRVISISFEYKRMAFVMIKPDAVQHLADIVKRFNDEGFAVRAIHTVRLDNQKCGLLYKEHVGKPHYERHRNFITYRNCIAMTIESSQYQDDTWKKVREICGATDPQKADPTSIRGMFGSELPKNAIHASDSEELSHIEASLVLDLPGSCR